MYENVFQKVFPFFFLKMMTGFVVVIISIVNVCWGQSFDITTNLTYGMQTYGHMFDVVSTQQPINIQNIGLHFSLNNFRSNVKIYSKKGSWIGYDSNITEWTLIHQTSVITSSNALTNLGILQINVIIPAKETQAFYIIVTGSTLEYGNTSYITGNVYKSDNNIQLLTGIAKGDFTESVKHNAVWNGYIYYEYECDEFKMIDQPGTYSLRAYQDEIVVPGEKICYQIDKGYSCKDPYISIIAKGIDIDQYSSYNEYIEIKYNKDGITQKVYDHCHDANPCLCCGKNITCVNEYVADNIFESGIIYEWTLTNGDDVDALCTGPETMDAQIILTCNGTKTPTLSPTISTSNPSTITLAPTTNPTITPTMSPTHCQEFVEINKAGSYPLKAYATQTSAERTLCWTVSPNYTCYYPELTVVTKEIDYDGNNEWLRSIFRINGGNVKNYGQCKGNTINNCNLKINCVDDKIQDPLTHGNLYEVRLSIGSQVHSFCSPPRTMDADVTITCYDSNSPTMNPTIPSMFPTRYPTAAPTFFPSIEPSIRTQNPTLNTIAPSQDPSMEPTMSPTQATTIATLLPSDAPTMRIINVTSTTDQVSANPTLTPSKSPSVTSDSHTNKNNSFWWVYLFIIVIIAPCLWIWFIKRRNSKLNAHIAHINHGNDDEPDKIRSVIATYKLSIQTNIEGEQNAQVTNSNAQEINDDIIAQEYELNQIDLKRLTKGEIKPNDFKTNNGNNDHANDAIIAKEYELNQIDLMKLTNGQIKPNEFITDGASQNQNEGQ